MIISNQQVQAILRLYGASKTKAAADAASPDAPEKAKSEQTGDRAELSDKVQLFQKARQAALNVPEVREELIGQVKEKIDNGSYRLEPEAIAEKILSRLLIDKIV